MILQGMTRNWTKYCRSLKNSVAQRVTDTSSIRKIKMRELDRSKAVLLLLIRYVISGLFSLCFHARLFIDALLSPAGKGLTSWLSFVVSNCEVVTFPLIPWVSCGT